MSVYIGDVQTFAGVIADKPQVLKIGEETMEVFSAWECWKNLPQSNQRRADLVNEIADVIQAACNLLAAIGVDDMRQPMQECYVRNVERGREYSSSGDSMDEQQDSIRTRPISNGTCPIDEPQSVDVNDSREKLEDDVGFIVKEGFVTYKSIIGWLDRQAAITANETNYNNPYVGLVRGKQWERTEISDYYCGRCGWKVTDHDSYCPECGGALHKAPNKPDGKSDAPKTAESGEIRASKDDIRDFDDSREKLEADKIEAINSFLREHHGAISWNDELRLMSDEWLDRQAAITERECRKPNWDYCETCEALEELKAENEVLKARIESLRSKLSKMLDAASAIQHIGDLP